MRTFHTYTNACGGAHGEHAGAIGRLHSPCAYTSATTVKSTGNLKAKALTYSGETSTDLMVKSLEDGLCYVRSQITGLSDTGFIIKELLLSLPDLRSSNGLSCSSTRKFFLESLRAISGEKHKCYPLFGYENEPPVKLHLRINGKRMTESLSPVPLLSQPSFRSVCLTLGLDEEVEKRICEESATEVLNLMISRKSKEARLLELSHKLNAQRSRGLSLPGQNRHRLPNFLNTLKSCLCKSMMPRSRPDVPV